MGGRRICSNSWVIVQSYVISIGAKALRNELEREATMLARLRQGRVPCGGLIGGEIAMSPRNLDHPELVLLDVESPASTAPWTRRP